MNYGTAILEGFKYLLSNYPETFVIGQGLWSPWYVGNTMSDLDKIFGKSRVIDTPVSESACTSAAIGASLCGMRPIVVHPRMDFMLYAVDGIVNQAAKWNHMTGGQDSPKVTIRSIVNRGGQQGAQHSQSLHAWFAHIPGLRVVMPSTVQDARDLLIASVLSNEPVIYIDDRWLYSNEETIPPINKDTKFNLSLVKPNITKKGNDITLVGNSFSHFLLNRAAEDLSEIGYSCEVIDLRIINPLDESLIIESVSKTGRLLVVDGGWANCGLASEIIARICLSDAREKLKCNPIRITLPDAPAPCSKVLEEIYYPDLNKVKEAIFLLIKNIN